MKMDRKPINERRSYDVMGQAVLTLVSDGPMTSDELADALGLEDRWEFLRHRSCRNGRAAVTDLGVVIPRPLAREGWKFKVVDKATSKSDAAAGRDGLVLALRDTMTRKGNILRDLMVKRGHLHGSSREARTYRATILDEASGLQRAADSLSNLGEKTPDWVEDLLNEILPGESVAVS